jgi:hypothetical protein
MERGSANAPDGQLRGLIHQLGAVIHQVGGVSWGVTLKFITKMASVH